MVPLGIADAGYLTWGELRGRYVAEHQRVMAQVAEACEEGFEGHSYNTQPLQLSRLFARPIIESTHERFTATETAVSC